MGSFIKKKLFYQTLAFILPFVVVSIAATGLILSITNNRFFQKTILQNYTNIIRIAAGEISLFLESSRTDLESLALVMASLKLDPGQKEIALTAFLHQNPRFSAIDLIPARKNGSGSVEPGTLFQETISDKELLDRALSGRTAVSEISAKEKELPYVDFAVPVDRLGEVDEILLARVSLKFIWDILESIHIGEKGQVYVMDGSGRIIAHRQIHRVLLTPAAETPEVLAAIRETEGPVEWINATDDTAAYNLGIYVPGLDWIIVLSQPRWEVYGYLYQNFYWALVIGLFISLCAVLWGWRGSRRLLAPIQALHGQVQHIGQGNLDRKVFFEREDEIGELGKAFNDMTDSLKHYMDQEVEAARILAQTKNLAALGMVASKVSHEMGNFLFGLQMMLAGLKKEPLGQSGQTILKNIENEMALTRVFIQAYMNFAKRPPLNFIRGPLDKVIRDVLEILDLEIDGPEAHGHDIALTLDWDPAIPPIHMDTRLIGQVFTNLVKNALEAMDGAGNLAITGNAAGETLLVSVADTGPGVDAETREKLFEPFFSTKGVMGTGLGLAIVKSNIEAHGGTIECASEEGKGTTFLIRLPMKQK